LQHGLQLHKELSRLEENLGAAEVELQEDMTSRRVKTKAGIDKAEKHRNRTKAKARGKVEWPYRRSWTFAFSLGKPFVTTALLLPYGEFA
jgi:hypothetical protein